MFCPKCGTRIEEGDLFCPNCGTRVSAPSESNDIVGSNNVIETVAYDIAENSKSRSIIVKPKKRIDAKWIIGIVLIILVAAGAFAALKLFGGRVSGEDSIVMLSDGDYVITSNPANEKKNVELASAHNDYTYDNAVRFSPDGKYVYYYTKLEDYSGSLCRAEIGKLKKGSSKNDKYIETIASNAMPGLHLMRKNTLLYMAGEDSLYYFDGNESIQIAKNVFDYWTDKNYRVVFLASQGEEEYDTYALYGVDLNDIDNKFKMASDVSEVNYVDNFDRIVFKKRDSNDNYSLYITSFGKEPEKISNSAYILSDKEDQLIYIEWTGRKLNLYDYVDDDATGYFDFYYDYIREELQDDENAVNVYNMYVYHNGEKKLVAENVIDAYEENGMIVYNTVDMINEKVSITDVEYPYDVARIFDINYETANYILDSDLDNKLRMDEKTIDTFGLYDNEDCYVSFYVVGSSMYARANGAIYELSVKDGEIVSGKLIADEGEIFLTDDGNFYFSANGYDNNDSYYYDIYKVSDGEKVRIAQDVADYSPQIYEDGKLLAYTDYRYYNDEASGELAIFNPDGESKKVGDDVTQFVRVDKNNILFIADDNLYLFDGKEKELLQNDVEQIWCKNYMKQKKPLFTPAY